MSSREAEPHSPATLDTRAGLQAPFGTTFQEASAKRGMESCSVHGHGFVPRHTRQGSERSQRNTGSVFGSLDPWQALGSLNHAGGALERVEALLASSGARGWETAVSRATHAAFSLSVSGDR
jgi:hypothetical protein